jgi:co-chaperonin GroES (HSP10)
MRKFCPLGDRLLVRPDAPTEKKTIGLAAPPSQKEAATEGIVVAGGPDAIKYYMEAHRRGEPTPAPAGMKTNMIGGNPKGVMVGERIQYTKYAGREVMHDGVKHKLLRLEECEGIIEETPE